jgi:hypothetical protein
MPRHRLPERMHEGSLLDAPNLRCRDMVAANPPDWDSLGTCLAVGERTRASSLPGARSTAAYVRRSDWTYADGGGAGRSARWERRR